MVHTPWSLDPLPANHFEGFSHSSPSHTVSTMLSPHFYRHVARNFHSCCLCNSIDLLPVCPPASQNTFRAGMRESGTRGGVQPFPKPGATVKTEVAMLRQTELNEHGGGEVQQIFQGCKGECLTRCFPGLAPGVTCRYVLYVVTGVHAAHLVLLSCALIKYHTAVVTRWCCQGHKHLGFWP